MYTYIYIYMYPGTRRAVDERFINGATAALRSWLLSGGPSPYCLCKPFSCKACFFCLFIQLVERACKTKVVVMVTCIYIYIHSNHNNTYDNSSHTSNAMYSIIE